MKAEVLDEVREYLPVLAGHYAILPEALESQFRLLAVRPFDPSSYRRQLPEARRRMGFRDPDDVDLLALALTLRIPVWSNDRDFGAARVEWYTTPACWQNWGSGGGEMTMTIPQRGEASTKGFATKTPSHEDAQRKQNGFFFVRPLCLGAFVANLRTAGRIRFL